jgi:uncharacterized protein YgiM (DUF1202 family)
MARFILPAVMLGSVALLSGAVTYAGASFTLNKIAEVAQAAPIKSDLKPSYVAALAAADAEALDVARSVPVVVRGDPAEALQARHAAQPVTHTVAVQSLRVRSGPHKSTPQVFALKGGSLVTVTREERGWVLIDAGNGRVGWVYSRLLRPAEARVATQG